VAALSLHFSDEDAEQQHSFHHTIHTATEKQMNSRQFFDKVALMRKYQKEYFRTKTQSSLRQSKYLEQEIDKEIERVQKILGVSEQTPKQGSIFD
jgi:hypothetical protein